jgi:hypothetical protein
MGLAYCYGLFILTVTMTTAQGKLRGSLVMLLWDKRREIREKLKVWLIVLTSHLKSILHDISNSFDVLLLFLGGCPSPCSCYYSGTKYVTNCAARRLTMVPNGIENITNYLWVTLVYNRYSSKVLHDHVTATMMDVKSNRTFSNSKHTAVLTDYRLICAGLASFMSKLFIGTSESQRNLKVFVLL